MNLHDYLPQREHDLLNDLETLRTAIAALQVKLIPLESELANVRRAMSAIGIGSGVGLGAGDLSGLAALGGFVPPPSSPDWLPPPSLLSGILPSSEDALRSFFNENPYANLTMKQLVVKALSEHYHNGATTRELLDFFRDAWDRNIKRENLSPQLSRLAAEGIIVPTDERKWMLAHVRLTGRGQV
jgi:hypothetical protein